MDLNATLSSSKGKTTGWAGRGFHFQVPPHGPTHLSAQWAIPCWKMHIFKPGFVATVPIPHGLKQRISVNDK